MKVRTSLNMWIANYINQLLKYHVIFNFLLFKFIEYNERCKIEENYKFKSYRIVLNAI